MDRTLLTHLVVLLGLTALAVGVARAEPPEAQREPSSARQEELTHLLRQDCGSCHGMSLKGGLGPALLPETLTGKPADSLVATVLYGRPGTAMPGWSRFMNEGEAQWLVARLQGGLPPLAMDRR